MTNLRNPTAPHCFDKRWKASWLRHYLIVYSTCRKVQTQWPPCAIYHLGAAATWVGGPDTRAPEHPTASCHLLFASYTLTNCCWGGGDTHKLSPHCRRRHPPQRPLFIFICLRCPNVCCWRVESCGEWRANNYFQSKLFLRPPFLRTTHAQVHCNCGGNCCGFDVLATSFLLSAEVVARTLRCHLSCALAVFHCWFSTLLFAFILNRYFYPTANSFAVFFLFSPRTAFVCRCALLACFTYKFQLSCHLEFMLVFAISAIGWSAWWLFLIEIVRYC